MSALKVAVNIPRINYSLLRNIASSFKNETRPRQLIKNLRCFYQVYNENKTESG